MKISDDERHELHRKLDTLLDKRSDFDDEFMDRLTSRKGYVPELNDPVKGFFSEGAEFLKSIIGPELHWEGIGGLIDKPMTIGAPETQAENLILMVTILSPFEPLWKSDYGSDNGRRFLGNMLLDFVGIRWGDSPRYFSLRTKNKGESERPYHLAHLKKSALDWNLWLKAAGVNPAERQNLLSSAYRTSWDAIRKWEHPIFDKYGIAPEWDGQTVLDPSNYSIEKKIVAAKIQYFGDLYWEAKASQ